MNQEGKVIFVDVDGTLVDYNNDLQIGRAHV